MKTIKSPIKLTNLLLIASIAVLLFGMGYKLGEYKFSFAKKTQATANSKNVDFSMFWKVWGMIEEKYVDQKKIDPKKMYYGAIKGLAASVEDPYTYFLTPTENQKSKDDLGGKYEGIGAVLGVKSGKVVVMSVLKDSPAEKANIKSGDVISKIDDKTIEGLQVAQVALKIRGDMGTKVHLTLIRDEKEIEFDVKRDTLHIKSIEVRVDEKMSTCTDGCEHVAYLSLNLFGDNTIDEWAQSIEQVKDKWDKKEIKGLVLDLRDNPGGYLEGSVYLAGEFLAINRLVVKQESTSYENKDYFVTRSGQLLDIPLTVLINGGSASSSEILAGALRDYKRATLIGEKSFGKGSVQEAIDLGDGMGLHVTVAKWVLPKGDWINGKGIEPEIKVTNTVPPGDTLSRPFDKQLDAAIERLLK